MATIKRLRFHEALDEMTDAALAALPEGFAPASSEEATSLMRLKRFECAEDLGIAQDRELVNALRANEAQQAEISALRRRLEASHSLVRSLPHEAVKQLCAGACNRTSGFAEMIELLALHLGSAQITEVRRAGDGSPETWSEASLRFPTLQRCLKALNTIGTPQLSVSTGDIEAVVAAMRAHMGVASVQENGCGALWNIAHLAENQPKVAVAGGIEAVVAAITAHSSIASVQSKGCGALLNIAHSAENRQKVAAAGGIETVVAAMKAHTSVSAVQSYGCGALWNIAFFAENQLKLAASGGIKTVVAAMKAHAGDADVQSYGCMALWNITRLAENRQKVAAAGGIEAVAAAMKAHTGVAAVQENGCGALWNIARLAENQL